MTEQGGTQDQRMQGTAAGRADGGPESLRKAEERYGSFFAGIVLNHNGCISVTSGPGGGAVFSVFIPRSGERTR